MPAIPDYVIEEDSPTVIYPPEDEVAAPLDPLTLWLGQTQKARLAQPPAERAWLLCVPLADLPDGTVCLAGDAGSQGTVGTEIREGLTGTTYAVRTWTPLGTVDDEDSVLDLHFSASVLISVEVAVRIFGRRVLPGGLR